MSNVEQGRQQGWKTGICPTGNWV